MASGADRTGVGVLDASAPPAPDDDLGSLVARARDGDRAAIAGLYERHHRLVGKILAQMLGPDPDLADLVQDTFVRALRGLGALEHPEGFHAWLRRVAASTAMDSLRRRRTRRWLVFVAPESLPEVEAAPVDGEGRLAVRRLYEVLDRMSVEDRTYFVLRHVSGLTLADVGEAMGASTATVKRRVRRARERFFRHARRDAVLASWVLPGEGGEP